MRTHHRIVKYAHIDSHDRNVHTMTHMLVMCTHDDSHDRDVHTYRLTAMQYRHTLTHSGLIYTHIDSQDRNEDQSSGVDVKGHLQHLPDGVVLWVVGVAKEPQDSWMQHLSQRLQTTVVVNTEHTLRTSGLPRIVQLTLYPANTSHTHIWIHKTHHTGTDSCTETTTGHRPAACHTDIHILTYTSHTLIHTHRARIIHRAHTHTKTHIDDRHRHRHRLNTHGHTQPPTTHLNECGKVVHEQHARKPMQEGRAPRCHGQELSVGTQRRVLQIQRADVQPPAVEQRAEHDFTGEEGGDFDKHTEERQHTRG